MFSWPKKSWQSLKKRMKMTREEEIAWLMYWVEWEEKNGEFLPGGSAGGAGAGMRKRKRELAVQISIWENEGGSVVEL